MKVLQRHINNTDKNKKYSLLQGGTTKQLKRSIARRSQSVSTSRLTLLLLEDCFDHSSLAMTKPSTAGRFLKLFSILLFITTTTIYSAPCDFSVSIDKTDVDCYGNLTGSASASIVGPSGAYTYSWSTGDSINDVINLKAATYFVKVTDDKGCEVLDFIQIDQPLKLSSTAEIEHVKCFGENTGSINITCTGGTGKYTYNYSWLNGVTNNITTDLYAGEYRVTISDENFCELLDTFQVNQPAKIADSKVIKDATGYKLKNGSIGLSITGGSKPYKYKWMQNTNIIDTIEDINSLYAGQYDFQLTDTYGCIFEKSYTVGQPDTLKASMIAQDVDCAKGTSGSIDITVTGGVQPYQFIWANKEVVFETATEDVYQLEKGMYYVTITDVKGNVFHDSAYVDEPSPILVDLNPVNVTCNGGSNGIVFTTVSGGKKEYSFKWSDGSDQKDLTNVVAGDYQVDIVDQNGCSSSNSITINEPESFVIEEEITQITCKDASDGAIALSVEGNSYPYTYSWSDGHTGAFSSELGQKKYDITITDKNNCDTTVSYTLMNPEYICIKIHNAFTPNNDGFNDTWIIENMELYSDISIYVYSKTGYLVYDGNIATEPWDGTYKGNELPSGTYYFTVNPNNGDLPFKGTVTIVR